MSDDLASRLDETAAMLVSVARDIRRGIAEARPAVAGIGNLLQERWAVAVAARADESAAAADRVLEASAAVRATRRQYAETDEFAAHRLRRSA